PRAPVADGRRPLRAHDRPPRDLPLRGLRAGALPLSARLRVERPAAPPAVEHEELPHELVLPLDAHRPRPPGRAPPRADLAALPARPGRRDRARLLRAARAPVSRDELGAR